MTLDLFSLRCFVEVARSRHFGEAARTLFVSQAQLSKRVRDLEQYLDVVLLDRTTRSVELTEAGAEVLVEAREILARVASLESRARRAARGEAGQLTMGVVGSTTFTILPRIMRVLRRSLPEVDVAIAADLLTPMQERMLRDREIDVGLLRLPVRATGLAWRTVDRDPIVLAVPSTHRLARTQGPVDPRRLRDERIVSYPTRSGSVVGDAVLRLLSSAGVEPNLAVEVTDTGTMLGLVAAGVGVALVPSSARRMAVDDVVVLELLNPTHVDIALAWREDDTSPLLRTFLSALAADGLLEGPDTSTTCEDLS